MISINKQFEVQSTIFKQIVTDIPMSKKEIINKLKELGYKESEIDLECCLSMMINLKLIKYSDETCEFYIAT